MSPLISHIKELGLIEARAIPQNDCFKAALQFAQTEASGTGVCHVELVWQGLAPSWGLQGCP